jgi:hypothetical protein
VLELIGFNRIIGFAIASGTYITHYGDGTPAGKNGRQYKSYTRGHGNQPQGDEAEMRAWREKMDAKTKAMRNKTMEANRNAWRKEMTACQERTEACLECKEPASEKMESEVEHQEVSKGDAVVKPVKGRKKRHGGRKLAAGRCGAIFTS